MRRWAVRRTALFVIAAALVALPAAAVTLRVPSEYPTINAGLDAAAFSDTVLVAAGTYTEPETRQVNIGTGGLLTVTSLAFMKDGVVLRSEEGPEITVLDLQGTGAGYCWVAVAGALASEETELIGFTLTGAPVGHRGMTISSSGRVAVRACIFRDLDAGSSVGGGIRCALTSLEVTACRFENCHAAAGGAIDEFLEDGLISDCYFEGCSEQALGFTGSEIFPGHSIVVHNCEFKNNQSSSSGGAIASGLYSYTTVTGCLFEENLAPGGGGAIMISGGIAVVEDNILIANHAGSGGGVYVGGLRGHVNGNTFFRCTKNPSSTGGAAAKLWFDGIVEFQNNIIVECLGGQAVRLVEGTITSGCNVFWGNADGNVEGFELDPSDQVVDPLFCDPENWDLTLAANSPCLPANSGDCGLIGALGQGCGGVAITPESWARLKGRYR
jgi:predicted outer membrane repeat protein